MIFICLGRHRWKGCFRPMCRVLAQSTIVYCSGSQTLLLQRHTFKIQTFWWPSCSIKLISWQRFSLFFVCCFKTSLRPTILSVMAHLWSAAHGLRPTVLLRSFFISHVSFAMSCLLPVLFYAGVCVGPTLLFLFKIEVDDPSSIRCQPSQISDWQPPLSEL